MTLKVLIFAFCFGFAACSSADSQASKESSKSKNSAEHIVQIDTEEKDGSNPFIQINDIPAPSGYVISQTKENSFEKFLQLFPLKKDRTVYKYDGTLKGNQTAQFAVLDLSVGKENLQQCADAVMRLRAEYLYKNREPIQFTDNEGGVYRFNDFGQRTSFDSYLRRVFGMCGTASLEKQLYTRRIKDLQIGDVFIKGGFPGHAVMVVNTAVSAEGEIVFLLAQSFMPAQDMHILNNPNDDGISPWYALSEQPDLQTPEYFFTTNQLKRW